MVARRAGGSYVQRDNLVLSETLLAFGALRILERNLEESKKASGVLLFGE